MLFEITLFTTNEKTIKRFREDNKKYRISDGIIISKSVYVCHVESKEEKAIEIELPCKGAVVANISKRVVVW